MGCRKWGGFMYLSLALFALGTFLIIKGGDWFVDAAGWLAAISGIPPVIIGATVVSLATTVPELLVSVLAAADGKVAMAAGNAVGSVNANIGLIMALSVIWSPAVFDRRRFGWKILLLFVACLLLGLFSLNGALGKREALILLGISLLFALENIYSAKKSTKKSAKNHDFGGGSAAGNLLKFTVGAAAVVVGARLLVVYGSRLALCLGVSEAVIGVTLVAIGTSLPELVTTVSALVKKQAELSIGNIIGANIIDLSLILPLCSLLADGTLPVCRQSIILDLPVSLLLVLLLVLPPLICHRFRRSQGVLLLLLYLSYMILVVTGVPLIFI